MKPRWRSDRGLRRTEQATERVLIIDERERIVREVLGMWARGKDGVKESWRNYGSADIVWWNCARGAVVGQDAFAAGIDTMFDMLNVVRAEVPIRTVAVADNVVFVERSDDLYLADGTLLISVPVTGVVIFDGHTMVEWRDYCDDWMRAYRPTGSGRTLAMTDLPPTPPDDGALSPDSASADTVAVVTRFMTGMSTLNTEAMLAEAAENIMVRMPAAPAGLPREAAGKETFSDFLNGVGMLWTQWSMPGFVVHPLADDPARAVIEYTSDSTNADGSPYRNTYLSIATVRGGQLVEFVEFFDTAQVAGAVAALARVSAPGTG